MKNLFLPISLLLIVACNSQQTSKISISKEEMLKIVTECDKQFSIGLQTKDSALLANIYSDSAQYVQPNRKIITGKTEIGKDWANFLRLKENPIDLIVNIKDVRGNREIIYETGTGYTLLADSTRWNFNYVNVWRLQADGSYKLEIDTFN